MILTLLYQLDGLVGDSYVICANTPPKSYVIYCEVSLLLYERKKCNLYFLPLRLFP